MGESTRTFRIITRELIGVVRHLRIPLSGHQQGLLQACHDHSWLLSALGEYLVSVGRLHKVKEARMLCHHCRLAQEEIPHPPLALPIHLHPYHWNVSMLW